MGKIIFVFMLNAGFSAANAYMFVSRGKPLYAAITVFSGLCAIFIAMLATKVAGKD